MDEIDELFNIGNEETVEKILSQLLTTHDIQLKTNLPNPLALVKMQMIADHCEAEGLVKSSLVINSFIKHFMEFRPSKDGERANQIVKAFSDVWKVQAQQQVDMLGRVKE